MDSTTKKLIRLLDGSSEPELRQAAMRVVIELGVNSQLVVRSLGRALREESESIRTLALTGLAKLGARDVVDQVIPLLQETNELRDRAIEVVVSVGEPAVEPLKSLYNETDYQGKRAIATALSRVGTHSTFEFIFQALQYEPFEIQKHLSQCLCEAIDRLPAARQKVVFKQVQKFLELSSTKKDMQSLVIGIIVLGHFRGRSQVQQARRILSGYADKKNPPEVRRYALMSLTSTLQEVPLKPDIISFLEKCLCDSDWNNVAQHALLAFQRLDLLSSKVLKLLNLLKESPHSSVHIHVFQRLSKEDRPEVAKAIISFLADSRYRVREVAEETLRSMTSAIDQLFVILADSDDLDLCHRVRAILREYPQAVKRKHLDRAIKLFLRLFDRNDRRYEFFLDFIRDLDPQPLRKTVYEKVAGFRKGRSKDRWLRISRYLQVLWDQHLITAEGRYLFALALIKLNNKDLSPHARRANLGLQVIRSLIYDNTPALVARLTKNKDLTAEDFFYIGFHFLEEGEELRPFAKSILEFVVRKHAKTKMAKVARQKLESLKQQTEQSPAARLRQRARRKKLQTSRQRVGVRSAALRPARKVKKASKGKRKSAAKSGSKTKAKTKSKAKSKTKTKTKTRSKTKSKSKPKSKKSKSKSRPRSTSRPKGKVKKPAKGKIKKRSVGKRSRKTATKTSAGRRGSPRRRVGDKYPRRDPSSRKLRKERS